LQINNTQGDGPSLIIDHKNDDDDIIQIFNDSTRLFTIDPSGNVGIFNSNPQYSLDVTGNINFTGNLTQSGTAFSSYTDSDVTSLLNSGITGGLILNSGDLKVTDRIGIGTSSPDSSSKLHIFDTADLFKVSQTQITTYKDIIPGIDDSIDLGSSDFKFRDIYVGENSLWVGDKHKIVISDGKMKFRKRKTDFVPDIITTSGGSSIDAMAFSGVDIAENMQIKHWLSYLRTLPNAPANSSVKDLFRDNTDDYDEEISTDSWLSQSGISNNIYLGSSYGNVGFGNNNPQYKLDVDGDINITSTSSFKINGSAIATTDTTVLVTDTTPQLGGNLDVNDNDIISTTDKNINIDPAGNGDFVIKGNVTRGSGSIKLNCDNNSHGVKIKGPPHSAGASYTLTLPDNVGTANQLLSTDGSGALSFITPAASYTNSDVTALLNSGVSGGIVSLNDLIVHGNLKTMGGGSTNDPIINPTVSINNIDSLYKCIILQNTGDDQTSYDITFSSDTICDILIIGGGGGGARRMGGGGGAGALIYDTDITLNGTYTIKVGKGGLGSATSGNIDNPPYIEDKRGNNGVDSEIIKSSSTIYKAKGGGGGLGGNTDRSVPSSQQPLYGGSGGGNGGKDNAHGGLLSESNIVNSEIVTVLDNSYSLTQSPSYNNNKCFGNEGGVGAGGSPWLGSGGGGAGSKGTDVNVYWNSGNRTANNTGGIGGYGKEINITGENVYYAAGGGGGNWSGVGFYNDGGIGGGGRSGTNSTPPSNAVDGTGSGGGGDGPDIYGGGNGGSGIVIIRYLSNTETIIESYSDDKVETLLSAGVNNITFTNNINNISSTELNYLDGTTENINTNFTNTSNHFNFIDTKFNILDGNTSNYINNIDSKTSNIEILSDGNIKLNSDLEVSGQTTLNDLIVTGHIIADRITILDIDADENYTASILSGNSGDIKSFIGTYSYASNYKDNLDLDIYTVSSIVSFTKIYLNNFNLSNNYNIHKGDVILLQHSNGVIYRKAFEVNYTNNYITLYNDEETTEDTNITLSFTTIRKSNYSLLFNDNGIYDNSSSHVVNNIATVFTVPSNRIYNININAIYDLTYGTDFATLYVKIKNNSVEEYIRRFTLQPTTMMNNNYSASLNTSFKIKLQKNDIITFETNYKLNEGYLDISGF